MTIASLSLALLFALLPLDAQNRLEACDVTPEAFEELMTLDLQKFDQDMAGGWRAIANIEGCDHAAADAIKAYLHFSRPSAPAGNNLLRWHAGQSLAFAGQYEEARAFFQASYSTAEDGGAWNLYVDATLGFLDGDMDRMVAARNALKEYTPSEDDIAAMRAFLAKNPHITFPEEAITQPQNMNVVQSLIRCVGSPYSVAYPGNC